jgi:hypothetical protein
MGEGLTISYPIGDRVPPVTRIDHALITNEIAVLSVKELTIPGSDRSGFVTRLAVQQRPQTAGRDGSVSTLGVRLLTGLSAR